MKKVCVLFLLFFVLPVFATGISGNSAPCDNATLSKYNGTANIEINWEPNVIGLKWYNDNQQVEGPTSCTYDGMITVPPQPTKLGYTFNGWKVWKPTVPNGYTELEYVVNTSGTYLNTGITQNVDDLEMEIKAQPTTGSWYIFQNEETSIRQIYGIGGSINGNTISWSVGVPLGVQGYDAGVRLDSSIIRYSTHTYVVRGMNKNGNMTLYVKDLTTNEEDTKFGTYTYVQHAAPFWLFGNRVDNHRVSSGNKVYYAKMHMGGALVMNYIPARRNSDNVVGMWDTVTQTFFTNSGSGTFTAGPVVQ